MNVMSVSKQAVLDNYNFLQSLKPLDAIFPVLKSNAYGHGIEEIAGILKDTPAPYLCVDSYPEYQIARKYSNKDILIIGETLPENYRFFDHKHTAISVYNISTLKYLAKKSRPRRVHLFLNT
jgi:alanine racemase